MNTKKEEEITTIDDDVITLKSTKSCGDACVMDSPNTIVPMIACRLCDVWFHRHCVGMPDASTGTSRFLLGSYVCVDCSTTLDGESQRRSRKRRHVEALDAFLAEVATRYARLRQQLMTDEELEPDESGCPSRYIKVETLTTAGAGLDVEQPRRDDQKRQERVVTESGGTFRPPEAASGGTFRPPEAASGRERQSGSAAESSVIFDRMDRVCADRGLQTEPRRMHHRDPDDDGAPQYGHRLPDFCWSDPRPAAKRRRLLAWRDSCNESFGHHDDSDREVSFHRRHRMASPREAIPSTDAPWSAHNRRHRQRSADCCNRHRDCSTDDDSDDRNCRAAFCPTNRLFHNKRISGYRQQSPTSSFATISGNSEISRPTNSKSNLTKNQLRLREHLGESSAGSINSAVDSGEMEEDSFLYCFKCRTSHLGNCPLHGAMRRIHDSIVSKDDPRKAVSSLPPGFLIRESSLPDAGLGVFSLKEVAQGVVIGPYGGKITYDSHDTCDSDYCWHIVQTLRPSYCVNGKDIASSNWLRFINCANEFDQQNLTAFQYKGQIFYRTIKRIKKGSELLVWYGQEYAKVLGLDSETPTFRRRCKRTIVGQRSTPPVVGQRVKDEPALLNQKILQNQLASSAAKKSRKSNTNQTLSFRKKPRSAHGGGALRTSNKQARCRQCRRLFSNVYGLRRHMAEVHEGQLRIRPCTKVTMGSRQFHCKSCLSKFYTKVALLAHQKRKHR